MKNRRWLATLAMALLGGMAVALLQGVAPGRGAVTEAPMAAVVTANGKTEGAREELLLRSEIAGTIAAIHVRANQDVAEGTLLVELRNATQKRQVGIARAERDRTRAQCQRAKSEHERSQRLSSTSISLEKKEADQTLYLEARARLDECEERLHLAEAVLAKTELRAQWPGRVLRVWAEPGALVGPTSTKSILLFADVSQRRVRAFVEELDAHRPCVGQRALVTVDGQPGREFSGRVVEVLKRMDTDAPRSDAPGEYTDIDYLPVVIQLVNGDELPLNHRVKVRIHVD